MAALLFNTPRSGARARSRLLGDAVLATMGLMTMVGAVVTIAQPETLHGSAPVVLQVHR